MKNYLLIAQGSQAIQLLRELFSLNIKPEQISVITIGGDSNKSFNEFLDYYQMNHVTCSKSNFDGQLGFFLKNKKDLVISFSNPFIIDKKHLKKSKFINFHPGVLPKYKGSLSTVWSMINGEKLVGGTWHYLTQKVDSGNILSQIKIPVSSTSTSFSLNHSIFSKVILMLEEVLTLVDQKSKGKKQSSKGKFYYNEFPSLDHIKDEDLKYRINYFPPNFK